MDAEEARHAEELTDFCNDPGVLDVQQILTVPQVKLVRKIGSLAEDQFALVEQAVRNWLAL